MENGGFGSEIWSKKLIFTTVAPPICLDSVSFPLLSSLPCWFRSIVPPTFWRPKKQLFKVDIASEVFRGDEKLATQPFLVLATDGIWDEATANTVVDEVRALPLPRKNKRESWPPEIWDAARLTARTLPSPSTCPPPFLSCLKRDASNRPRRRD